MKEFKFDVDGDGIAIPVIRCETQREFNQTVASYRTDGKLSTNDPDGEVIYIIYKDGSTFYHNSADVSLNEGKYKRTGILRGVSSNPDGYEVFGDFAIDEYGNIVIDEKSIEEYGVYAGQYDVTEQDEQEVQETVEQTVETIAEGTSEVETTEQAQAEENKDTFEYRNYIISGNERTGIIAIDNHGNFSPKVYKTVEEAKKAVEEDIEYAEKKYAEMEAEQTEVEETAETETEETIKTTAEQETAETGEGISKMETTTGTDDSGFEYYSVETAYEVDFRDRQNEVFKTYSEAEKTAGDNIILEVDLIVRNDKKAVSEHDKEVFEDETDEIECRCIWYHHNGVKGMIAQDTKRVIKKPETAEVSKEVKGQFEKQKTSFKFYDVSIAYQVERYVNCGSLKYVQLGTYSDYAKAVKASQKAIEDWGEENIYFHTVEFAKRNSEPIKNNKKVFKSETHEIDYYWISARLTDTKECGYINIDSPIRIPNV